MKYLTAIGALMSGIAATGAPFASVAAKGGHNISQADAWVAVTAWTREIPLVTDNARHFAWIPNLELRTYREKGA